MPELPEVETVRRTLADVVVGRTIVGLRPRAFADVMGGEDISGVADRVQGHRIVGLRRRGKYLFLDLDDDTALMVHLRMTGRLTLADRDAAPLRFEHLAIELDDGSDLRFADQRKFGRVRHVLPTEMAALEQRLGPEPLNADFSVDTLAALLARRPGKLKSVLLDQRVLAGLGNIYADEALFAAGLHPERPANSLDREETRRLHAAIQAVLRQGIAHRGTTFSSFADGRGEAGENQERLHVYGRARRGEACWRCGGPLRLLKVGGRTTHFCPRCQPGPTGPE